MLANMSQDLRGFSPSTARNKEPILQILREVLPTTGRILEIASGTGEHIMFFAEKFPGLQFQPSDIDPKAHQSINAWISYLQLPNVAAPLSLDASDAKWPALQFEAVLNMNMAHISPWEATLGLFRNSAKSLRTGGFLYMYGPFRAQQKHTAASNESFDQSLQERNPLWGVRDLEAVEGAAAKEGLVLERTIEMPANNFSLIFYRR
jgi:cyclopropane fatty-acyl-phospholipid synthase-like methyltransferase